MPRPGSWPELRRPRHIGLHLFHVFGRLERNAARIEGNRFPDKYDADARFFFLAPLYSSTMNFGGSWLPARHAEKRAHPQMFHVASVRES